MQICENEKRNVFSPEIFSFVFFVFHFASNSVLLQTRT